MAKQKITHFNTNIGLIAKTDIKDWEKVYKYYCDEMTFQGLHKLTGLSIKVLQKYFKIFGFKLRSKEDHNKSANKRRASTSLEKYGVSNINKLQTTKDKKKQTCLSNFGVEYSLQDKSIRKNIKNTNMIKYGFDNPSKSSVVKERIKQTCLIKYGVESVSQLEAIKEKNETNLFRKIWFE